MDAQAAAAGAGDPVLPEQRAFTAPSRYPSSGDDALPQFGPLSRQHLPARDLVRPGRQRAPLALHDRRRRPQQYLRLAGSGVLAARFRAAFRSAGQAPDIFYFGGNMELRGYPYLSFVGSQGSSRTSSCGSRSSTS